MRTLTPLLLASLAVLPLAACGESGPVTITEVREVGTPPGPGTVPEAVRLRVERPAAPPAAAGWAVDLPPGWRRLPGRPLRDPNLVVDGADGVECYLTETTGGTLADNINRWRSQLGAAALSPAEVEALPREVFAGAEGTFVDLAGDMDAMGTRQAGVRLLGLVRAQPGRVLTLKMVGPDAAVAGLRADFLRVAAGLRPAASAPPGHAAPAVASPDEAPAPAADPPPPGPLTWSLPDGWREGPPVPFSAASFEVGPSPAMLVTVSILGGDAGGWSGNVARWAMQMGQAAPAADAREKAEHLPVLGTEAPLVRFDGPFTSRDGSRTDDATLVAVWAQREGDVVVIKAIGPTATVEAELGRLRAFCRSLDVTR